VGLDAERRFLVEAPAEDYVADAQLDIERSPTELLVRLAGSWRVDAVSPSLEPLWQAVRDLGAGRVRFDGNRIEGWDSTLLTVLLRIERDGEAVGATVDRGGLPEGVQRLLKLATAVPERSGARRNEVDESLLDRIGKATLTTAGGVHEMLAFTGDVTASIGRFLRGRARYRRTDLLLFLQQAGAEALPIVTLISFLVGTIFAFVGAVQLQQFGATIYVANLVGIAMVREMGAMMTAIVMSGRTGAAYAAQLGSMKVTQEIDALTTMGIAPMDFLVLPRMLALLIMMPLLCLYSDFVGILGGAAIGVGLLDVPAVTYYQQTIGAVDLGDLLGGLMKASVYGILIALSGCLRGMQSGNSSSAVGDATTAAVVTSIVFTITACGIFAVLFYILGI